jgi:L,D-peptidoglycan transpeptidase YkuD (ErfK/YbiS/YcfS/YnhG family)
MSRPFRPLSLMLLLVTLLAGCQAAKSPSLDRAAGIAAQARPTAAPAATSPLAGANQLVLVVAKDWNANQAVLRRFERSSAGTWRPLGEAVAVTLGRNGLAWGLGLHGGALGPGPVKVEGDGRSPAGVFTFSTAFAYEPKELWKPTKMPMHQVTDRTVCVETIASQSYNRILDEDDTTPRDWVGPDRMLRPDGLYRYGLFVDHNAPDTKPGAGSCIFLHIWRRPGAPTAGCTAMNPTAVQVILTWMDSARKPILVQLPQAELDRLAPVWGAPELTVPPKPDDQ